MTYSFADATAGAVSSALPAEAMSVNGEYLENLIDGFRTLYVQGRESLAEQLSTFSTNGRDGSRLSSADYPEREITVGYQLTATTAAAFREAYNELGEILQGDLQLIFADETDKYFNARLSRMGNVPAGRLSVKAEMTFLCMDPFKYSVREYSVSPGSDDTFLLNYGGTVRCHPVLQAVAASDLGYVAYLSQDEKIIQIGDVEEADGESKTMSETLIAEHFRSTSAWTANAATTVYAADNHTQAGSTKITTDSDGNRIVAPSGFSGANKCWYGPSLTQTLSAPAVDLTYSFLPLLYCSSAKQRGAIQFLMTDGSGDNVAALSIYKTTSGNNTGCVGMVVKDRLKKKITFTIGSDNAVSGRKASRCAVTKMGGTFTFEFGGQKYTFTDSSLAETAVAEVSIYFAAVTAPTAMAAYGCRWAKVVAHNVEYFEDIPNKFTANDVIVADCSDGSITVDDAPEPGLGALGNDWEEFVLVPGTNQIKCLYSDWADAPTFTLKYREVFV